VWAIVSSLVLVILRPHIWTVTLVFPEPIASLNDEIARVKGDFAQPVVEPVTRQRQKQLSEEVMALESLVFPQLDSKIPTDFPPIVADSNRCVRATSTPMWLIQNVIKVIRNSDWQPHVKRWEKSLVEAVWNDRTSQRTRKPNSEATERCSGRNMR
jgi:hypothetical protein